MLAGLAVHCVTGLTTPSGVVRLTDAASRRPVLLVGTMHYNPYSVRIVEGTVRATSRQRGLHATAIELCPSRWNSTAAACWQTKRLERIPSYERLLSEDEFQVAFESAISCGLSDVVLADQPIALTGRRLGAALAQTAVDLLSPAGWQRVAVDLQTAARQLPTFARAAMSLPLTAGAPLAFLRYMYQSPAALPFAVISGAALAIAAAVDEATGAVATPEDCVISALLALVVGRAAFVSLIEERDRALASNIRRACLAEAASSDDSSSEGATVVAVLGIAHLAGVRSLLLGLSDLSDLSSHTQTDETEM